MSKGSKYLHTISSGGIVHYAAQPANDEYINLGSVCGTRCNRVTTKHDVTCKRCLAQIKPVSCEICGLEVSADFQRVIGEARTVCPTCYGRIEDYAAKVESRLTRLQDRAERVRAEAGEVLGRAEDMGKVIPFGQPILVGHHSEKRDRNYRDRIDRTYRRGFDLLKKSEQAAARAHAAEKNRAISSDDPAAVLKLQAKIDAAIKFQDEAKALNKLVRKFVPRPERMKLTGRGNSLAESNALFNAEKARVEAVRAGYKAHAPELAKLAGISETQAIALLTPDFLGRLGVPDYALKNNNANIRRMKQRLAELKSRNQEIAQADEPKAEEIAGDIKVVRDLSENRIRLVFPDKPDAVTRAVLKSHGFRWSPSNMAWQRQLNSAGEFAVTQVLQIINREGAK